MTEGGQGYDSRSAGSTLLLIHGFPFDHTLWRPQVDGLQGAARVMAPDLRGFGTAALAPETMTMEAYAKDLKAMLDRLGVARTTVCGLSMGGYVALAFLANYPEMVEGLILANTRATADSAEAGEARRATADKVVTDGASQLADAMINTLLTPDTLSGRAQLVAYIHAMMARQEPSAVAAALRGMAERPDRSSLLPRITVPTLVISSEDDQLIPLSESESMAEVIPGANLTVINGAAHVSNLESPDAFNQAVREFIETL